MIVFASIVIPLAFWGVFSVGANFITSVRQAGVKRGASNAFAYFARFQCSSHYSTHERCVCIGEAIDSFFAAADSTKGGPQ